MKGLRVYIQCAKAEFVTHFGPRAIGASPLAAQGLIMYYITDGGAGGAQK